MGNTLTGIIPILYMAVMNVSRELTGLIPSVFMNADAAQAAVGQTVTYPVAPASEARDIVAGTTSPDDGDQTIGNDSMTISKSRAVPVRWTGEEQLSVGSFNGNLLQGQFEQAVRTLTNEVESDLAALFKSASRAHGTAGTTPFSTAGDYTDASYARKILVDNGAPASELRLVVDTSAGANFRGKQAQAHMAGTDSFQRQGVLLDLHGFQIRESAKIVNHVKGTGTNYVTSGATAAGVKDIALVTGANTVLAGDVVTFAADTKNKYVVGAGITEPGTISLNNPGAMMTIPTANAMTIGGNFTANMAFARSAIHLIARSPAMPEGGDSAEDVFYITDPLSGLTFQVALYREYRRVKYEIGLAWGVKAVKKDWIALLLG
jgi:hypothetical protein